MTSGMNGSKTHYKKNQVFSFFYTIFKCHKILKRSQRGIETCWKKITGSNFSLTLGWLILDMVRGAIQIGITRHVRGILSLSMSSNDKFPNKTTNYSKTEVASFILFLFFFFIICIALLYFFTDNYIYIAIIISKLSISFNFKANCQTGLFSLFVCFLKNEVFSSW